MGAELKWWWAAALWMACACACAACPLAPEPAGAPKAPGDNYYRLIVNGDVERYAPGQRYVVTLVGSRTHDVVQQFTRFKLSLEPLDPGVLRAPSRQGQFQLFADTLSQFDPECINSVVEADDLPKTEVQVMWKAPPAGSGCVLLKAMVYENESRWFAEDGQLTRRVCEDTSLSAADCCACDDAKYKMVFEGLWSPQTHPKDFPTQAMWLTHFSDVIGATHPKNFSFWGEGQIATDGFRSLAEWGSVELQERELRQQGKLLRSIVKAPGLWHPRVNGNTSAVFNVDRQRHLLSLASMFGPSPDWVVGVSGLDLCQKDCTWVESKVIDLFPYDAGTDNGISYMSPNSETVPRERIYRITAMYPEDPRAPFYDPRGRPAPPMARLYLSREKLISRGCDEQTLQSFVVEEASQAADRPECAVGEWGAWSACSVSCGKGLRMRTRQYRLPQKARMFNCDAQLVTKEMCVAPVAECQNDNAADADVEKSAGDVDDIGSICEVTEWGAWSECSVTCGAGVSTRRRHFINRMGFKKCPLVQIEENRKCMEAACTEPPEVPDPECPTTEWSAWAPCSAACGAGLRLRTRLLLVPPQLQRSCAARVALLQQLPCQGACATLPPATKREPAHPALLLYGAGLRLRTRLLLVPPQLQRSCAARVALLQQLPCQGACATLPPATKREPAHPALLLYGAGLRLRTRLLLVPPQLQRSCAARVALLQQLPCQGACATLPPATKREPAHPLSYYMAPGCGCARGCCWCRRSCSARAPRASRCCSSCPARAPAPRCRPPPSVSPHTLLSYYMAPGCGCARGCCWCRRSCSARAPRASRCCSSCPARAPAPRCRPPPSVSPHTRSLIIWRRAAAAHAAAAGAAAAAALVRRAPRTPALLLYGAGLRLRTRLLLVPPQLQRSCAARVALLQQLPCQGACATLPPATKREPAHPALLLNGAGLRLRTRLLLVPPQLQRSCAARVALLQQLPCQGACATLPPATKREPAHPALLLYGAGLRLRTRLLLVPPQLQRSCAARVALLQQLPCQGACATLPPATKREPAHPALLLYGAGLRLRTRLLLVPPQLQRSCAARVALLQQLPCQGACATLPPATKREPAHPLSYYMAPGCGCARGCCWCRRSCSARAPRASRCCSSCPARAPAPRCRPPPSVSPHTLLSY
ncbi:hypothetical protein ACJJTC_000054 [Scirpophaga incertulas]